MRGICGVILSVTVLVTNTTAMISPYTSLRRLEISSCMSFSVMSLGTGSCRNVAMASLSAPSASRARVVHVLNVSRSAASGVLLIAQHPHPLCDGRKCALGSKFRASGAYVQTVENFFQPLLCLTLPLATCRRQILQCSYRLQYLVLSLTHLMTDQS